MKQLNHLGSACELPTREFWANTIQNHATNLKRGFSSYVIAFLVLW